MGVIRSLDFEDLVSRLSYYLLTFYYVWEVVHYKYMYVRFLLL